MNCPEYTETQNDIAYQDYIEGHSRGAVGLLLLMVALDSVYTALDKENGDDNFDSSEQP